MANNKSNLTTFYGCDMDLRHGAISKITLNTDSNTVIDIQDIYRWGGKGSFTLGEGDSFPTMMRWIQVLADSILDDLTTTDIPVYIEWDKNRIFYAKARKKAVVQLAQAVGAFAAYLGPRVKLVTPREVKLLLPQKALSSDDFISMINRVNFSVPSEILGTFDTKGDYPDSIAAGLTGYRKYQIHKFTDEYKEPNVRDF